MLKSLQAGLKSNHQSPGNGRAPQRLEGALALLHGLLLERSFFGPGGRHGCLHHRGFLLDALDKVLPALLLKFTDRDAGKNDALGIGGGEQSSGALQNGAQMLAGTDAVHTGISDLALDGDGRTQIVPPGQLRHAENVTVLEGKVAARIVENRRQIHALVLTRRRGAARRVIPRQVSRFSGRRCASDLPRRAADPQGACSRRGDIGPDSPLPP